MSPHDLAQMIAFFLSPLAGALAAWGALRADVRHLLREVEELRHTTARAHERIDDVLTGAAARARAR